jgi:hypothetical protein
MDTERPYRKRLDQFTSWRDGAQTSLMKEKYQRALDITNAAVETYTRLVEAADNESAAYHDQTDRLVQSIATRRQELADRAATLQARLEQGAPEDDTTLTSDKTYILVGVMTEQARSDRFAIMDALRRKRVAAVPELEKALFKSILAPDASEFSREVAINAIEFAIGLVPVIGPAYDLGKRVLDLSDYERSKGKIADEHVMYLDAYCHAAERWCVAAETTIKRLKTGETGL